MLMTVQTNKQTKAFNHSYTQTRSSIIKQEEIKFIRGGGHQRAKTTCDYIMYMSSSVYLTFGAKILGLFGETRKEETIMGTEVEHLG